MRSLLFFPVSFLFFFVLYLFLYSSYCFLFFFTFPRSSFSRISYESFDRLYHWAYFGNLITVVTKTWKKQDDSEGKNVEKKIREIFFLSFSRTPMSFTIICFLLTTRHKWFLEWKEQKVRNASYNCPLLYPSKLLFINGKKNKKISKRNVSRFADVFLFFCKRFMFYLFSLIPFLPLFASI